MPRTGLDKGAVVKAAADLVNAEGTQALSLSAVARHLGVQTPSLYNHVAGLSGLQRDLALLNAQLLGDCMANAAIGKSGEQAVIALAQAYRRHIKQQPGVYMATLRASGTQTPVDAELQAAEKRVVDIILAVVASFGLADKDALHAVRALRSAVHGFAMLEVAGGFGLPLDCDESFRKMIAMLNRGLRSQRGR